MEKIYVKHLKEVIGSHEDALIINVLSKESFQKEHIPHSISIPFEDRDQFIQAIEKIARSKSQKVIVYCSSKECDASEKAAKALSDARFQDVLHFEGGMKEWKEADEPFEGSDA